MTTINYKLSDKKRQNTNKRELLLRLSIDRKHVFRAKTGLYIDEKSWNDKNQKIIVSRMRTIENASLIQLQGKIDALTNGIIGEIQTTPINIINKEWLKLLIIRLTDKPTDNKSTDSHANKAKSFIESWERFVSTKCKGRRVDHFRCTLRMIKRFCLYADISLELDALSADHLLQFEKFLQLEHTFFDSEGICIKHKNIYEQEPCIEIPKPRGINAVNSVMRKFRTFYNWAVKNNITQNNPFRTYKVPIAIYGTPFFMTSEERDKLFEFDFSSRPGLAIQRDIFVFQSNVGMRVGDLYELTSANVVEDAIEYVANKTLNETGITIRVPLSEQAKQILERHKSHDRVELFPFISTQKYNKAIKEMLRLAGIDRIITILNPTTRTEEQHPLWEVASSHMARRNFIGNLYNKTQDPNAIASMTGHTEGSKAFARYRNIDDTVKKSLISML